MDINDLDDYANCKQNIKEWIELLYEECLHPNSLEEYESIIQKITYINTDTKKIINILKKLDSSNAHKENKNDK